MKQAIIILFCIGLLLSCKTQKDYNNKGIAFLTLEKTSCKGQCPIFSLAIFEDGNVTYTGIKNVDRIGKYRKTISRSSVRDLKKTFVNSDFFSFDNEYTSKITDLPTTYISFTDKGQTKRIRDYSGAPQKIKDLEKVIEKIIESTVGWEKVE